MEILLPRMKYTHDIVGTHGGALLLERAPGACSGSKTPRVYRPLMEDGRLIGDHLRGSLPKSVPLDFGLKKTFAL